LYIVVHLEISDPTNSKPGSSADGEACRSTQQADEAPEWRTDESTERSGVISFFYRCTPIRVLDEHCVGVDADAAFVDRLSEKAVWWVVREYAKLAGIDNLAPHDLRRTCARLCHSAGGELEQIQFLFGHRSVETTERYLGSRQRLVQAVNDHLGIEPPGGS
jgi:hypothetical protein